MPALASSRARIVVSLNDGALSGSQQGSAFESSGFSDAGFLVAGPPATGLPAMARPPHDRSFPAKKHILSSYHGPRRRFKLVRERPASHTRDARARQSRSPRMSSPRTTAGAIQAFRPGHPLTILLYLQQLGHGNLERRH